MKPVNRNEAPKPAAEPDTRKPAEATRRRPIIGRPDKAAKGEKKPVDQRRRLSMVCGALAAVAVASLGVGAWQLNQAAQIRDYYESDLVQVVVAREDVAYGEQLGVDDVEVASVPSRFAPDDAASSVDDVVGLRANANITAGNALSLSTLQASSSPATLASAPEEGKVAYMVTLSPASGISPLLHVGDSVQVILGADGVDGQVVADDVRVLALDDALTGTSDDYSNVTLELDQEQATMLYNYVDLGSGSVHLALNPSEPDGGASEAATAQVSAGTQTDQSSAN